MIKRKSGELYIDTAITLFLTLMTLCICVNIFGFMYKYQQVNELATNVAQCCAVEGSVNNEKVLSEFNNYCALRNLNADKITMSSTNSDFIVSSSDGRVQYGNTIVLKFQAKFSIAFFGDEKSITIPFDITKTSVSMKYYKT